MNTHYRNVAAIALFLGLMIGLAALSDYLNERKVSRRDEPLPVYDVTYKSYPSTHTTRGQIIGVMKRDYLLIILRPIDDPEYPLLIQSTDILSVERVQ